jgi:hypothetical protein
MGIKLKFTSVAHPKTNRQVVTTQIFSRLKISSCIHGILHFKVFSKVLNLILQRILFQIPFSPNFRNKKVSERKYLKMSSIVMELFYIFPLVNFF